MIILTAFNKSYVLTTGKFHAHLTLECQDINMDLKMVGTLSKARLKEYESAFKVFDPKMDRGISCKEMATVIRACGGCPKEADVKHIWKSQNKDDTAKITFGEFIQMMEEHQEYQFEEQNCEETDLAASFQLFDSNGDGFICAEEMMEAMTDYGEQLNDEELADLMRDADTNGDGRIDYKEFVKMMYNF